MVGVVVVNSQGLILAGQRLKTPDVWGCPQGNCDGDNEQLENLKHLASEVVQRSCGLHCGIHIVFLADTRVSTIDEEEKYVTEDSEGCTDMQMHWSFFRCIDGFGDASAERMCNLTGQRSGEPEFSNVQWRPLSEVISLVPEAERPAYRALQDWLDPQLRQYDALIAAVDLEGCWTRTALACIGVVDLLLARGFVLEEAEKHAFASCVQLWEKTATLGEWRVTSFQQDGKTRRQTCLYPLGEWLQPFWCKQLRMHPDAGVEGVAKRYTAWLPDSNATCDGENTNDAVPMLLAHCTVSFTPLGREEVLRCLRNDRLVLFRRFWSTAEDVDVVTSEETFVRLKPK